MEETVYATVPFLFAVTVGQRTLNPLEKSIEGSNPFRCRKNQTGEKNEDIYDNPKFTANFVQQMLAYLSCQAIIVVRHLLFTKTGTVNTTVPYFFAVCPGGEILNPFIRYRE